MNGIDLSRSLRFLISFAAVSQVCAAPLISGINPVLAHSNEEGEVGIGAVVPWAGALWTNTYGPHLPHGSSDKLRRIDTDWNMTVRPESVGGTPANRMIHEESGQLFIGHHAISKDGKVRTIDPETTMPGRITANARHLTDPANKIYHVTMEDGFYEVDVHTLEVKPIIKDPINISSTHLPGYHGKGAYTGSGRVVIANNGSPDATFPSGCLASWDGTDWSVVARNQFTEVTGPGGLRGNTPGDDRLWATGWDAKSVRLFLMQDGRWFKFRLPKGSYTHDAAHGWNTEWPRIREVREGLTLMHMHGMFYQFPQTFSKNRTGGIRPIGSYCKMPVDYAWFNGKLVIGKDDASLFDNAFVRQSQSNLWIGDPDDLSNWGPVSGFGGVWLNDNLDGGSVSDPFLVGGFAGGTLHLTVTDRFPSRITIQRDLTGEGAWEDWKTVRLPKDTGYLPVPLDGIGAQWVRLANVDAVHGITAYFQLHSPYPNKITGPMFGGMADVGLPAPRGAALMLPKGLDLRLAVFTTMGAFEVDGTLKTAAVEITPEREKVAKAIAIAPNPLIGCDKASAWVTLDDKTNHQSFRLRLPKGDPAYDASIGKVRHLREVVTERTLLNLHGTFYEVPRPQTGSFLNFLQMKPISSHRKHIHDFCSWRGMLALSGAKPGITAANQVDLDANTSIWLGEVDDLWKFGKPVGIGGPLLDTAMPAKSASDPYLMLGYEDKNLTLSHKGTKPVTFGIEVDYLGTGVFSRYQTITVKPGETFHHHFPVSFAAHWVRVTNIEATTATATFTYR